MKNTLWKSLVSAVVISGCFLLAAQDTFSALKDSAEALRKEKKYKEAAELYEKALNASDSSLANKDFALDQLAWLYTWGIPPKDNFEKGAEQSIRASKLPGKKPDQIATNLCRAADMLLRAKTPDRKKILGLLEPLLQNKDLSDTAKIGVGLMLARTFEAEDVNKAFTYLDSAKKLKGTVHNRFDLRNAEARLKMLLKPADLDGAVAANMQSVNDPESNMGMKYGALLAIAKLYAEANRFKEAYAPLQRIYDDPIFPDNEKVNAALMHAEWFLKESPPNHKAAIELLKKYGFDSKVPENRRKDALRKIVTRIAPALFYQPTIPDRPGILALLEPVLNAPELSSDDKVNLYIVLIRVIQPEDAKKADQYLDRAMKTCTNVQERNRVRSALAGLRKAGDKPDIDAAVATQMQIVDDPESKPADKATALIEIARTYSNLKPPRLAEARDAVAKVAKISDVPENQRIDAILLNVDFLLRDAKPDRKAAVELLSSVVFNESFPQNRRMDAFRKLFNEMRHGLRSSKKEFADLFQKIWQTKGLSPASASTLAEMEGSWLRDETDFEAAMKAYEKLLPFDPSDAARNRVIGWQGSVYDRMGDFNKAAECYFKAENWDGAAKAYRKLGKFKEADKVLLDAYKKNYHIHSVMDGLINQNKFARVEELLDNELGAILKEKPDLGGHLSKKMGDAMQCANYKFALRVIPYVFAAGAKNQRAYVLAHLYSINANAQLGNKDEAIKAVRAAASDKQVTDTEFVFRFKVMNDALTANSKQGAFDVAKRIVDEYKTKMDVKLIPKLLSRAATSALLLNNRDVAEGIEDFRKSLYTKIENKKTDCLYYDKLPEDAESWMASDIVKNKKGMMPLDRQLWESNIDFLLETDAATTGRGVKESQGASGVFTELYTACDANGVHFFLVAYDNNAKAVINGLAAGGSYEGYMAPGPFQPYHCFLIDIASGKADDFNTAYKNEYTRRPTFSENEVKSSTRLVADNATATHIFYPWEFYYNVLPDKKGDAWQFDVMRWTGPGASWSGTVSVHNRSTWGDVVFDLTPAQVTAIRRNIVLKARRQYNAYKGNPWRGTGIFNFWSDPELGDVDFYNTKLQPLQKRLDEAATKIKLDMDDDTVNKTFLDVVPDMFNLPQVVSKLRTEYLKDKRFAE